MRRMGGEGLIRGPGGIGNASDNTPNGVDTSEFESGKIVNESISSGNNHLPALRKSQQ
jgi:hypothetical protein